MHIVHGPKGGTSVPKAVGHCVRMRTLACRMRGTSLGAKTTRQWTGFFFSFFFFSTYAYSYQVHGSSKRPLGNGLVVVFFVFCSVFFVVVVFCFFCIQLSCQASVLINGRGSSVGTCG